MNKVKDELDRYMGDKRFHSALRDRILQDASSNHHMKRRNFKWQYLLAGVAAVLGVFLLSITFMSPGPSITAEVPPAVEKTMEEDLLLFTEKVFDALEQHDYKQLASYVHPAEGLFFSFYADVAKPEVTFSSKELASLTGQEERLWGVDMAKQEFVESVDDYIDNYLLYHFWDKPLNYSEIQFNEHHPSGGTMNTIHEYYPDAKFVEYYSPYKEDVYWQALRFVYEEIEGKWYLIGIVRDVHSP